LGYTVIEAGDAVTALILVAEADKNDLLLTDVGLPAGMNGRQLADAVLQMLPNLPVVFITGYAEKAVRNDGDLERMRVLTKPFATERLAGIVREMIAISSH
jgi:CheY-like chemotaxis protein